MTHLMVHYFAMLFSSNNNRAYDVLVDLFKWSLFWTKYAGRWLMHHRMAHVMHAGVVHRAQALTGFGRSWQHLRSLTTLSRHGL
jgi:hypothetical protein